MPGGELMVQGLSESESASRLEREGPNELSRHEKASLASTLASVVKEPMILLLLAAGGIYLLLGDLEEALALLFSVLVVIGITLVQERKTERAVAPFAISRARAPS
jgi:Ca2+-transporting ATPase